MSLFEHAFHSIFFFFMATATSEIYTLSLHDALPISVTSVKVPSPLLWYRTLYSRGLAITAPNRSEEHTSELQSRFDLVCRLLLEKKKKTNSKYIRRLQRHHCEKNLNTPSIDGVCTDQ